METFRHPTNFDREWNIFRDAHYHQLIIADGRGWLAGEKRDNKGRKAFLFEQQTQTLIYLNSHTAIGQSNVLNIFVPNAALQRMAKNFDVKIIMDIGKNHLSAEPMSL